MHLRSVILPAQPRCTSRRRPPRWCRGLTPRHSLRIRRLLPKQRALSLLLILYLLLHLHLFPDRVEPWEPGGVKHPAMLVLLRVDRLVLGATGAQSFSVRPAIDYVVTSNISIQDLLFVWNAPGPRSSSDVISVNNLLWEDVSTASAQCATTIRIKSISVVLPASRKSWRTSRRPRIRKIRRR